MKNSTCISRWAKHVTGFGIVAVLAACGGAPQEAELKETTKTFELNEKVLREGSGPYYSLRYYDVLKQALYRSPVLKIFRSHVAVAQQKINLAWAPYYPHAEFIATYSHYSPAGAFINGVPRTNADEYDLTLYIRQVIYDFGRMKWSTLAAELDLKAAIEEYRRAVNKVIEDVQVAYIEAARSAATLETSQQLLAAREAHLKNAEALFKAGIIAKMDVVRSRSALAAAQEELMTAHRTHTKNCAAIYAFLGEIPSEKPLMLDALTIQSTPPDDKQGALQQALIRRPEVSALAWSIKAAEAYVKLARSGNNPYLTAEISASHRTPNVWEPSNQWSVSLQLVIPLWDGGETKAHTEIAKERVIQLEAEMEQSRRMIMLDTETQYTELHNAWGRMRLAQDTMNEAQEVVRLAQIRFKAGVGTSLEVLDAQAEYAAAKYRYSHALHDYLAAEIRWKRAISADFVVPVPGPREKEPDMTNLPQIDPKFDPKEGPKPKNVVEAKT